MDPIMRAIQLVEDKQNDEAIELLEKHLIVASAEDKYAVAELYMQWGYLQKAKVILDELLQVYPNEGELKLLLADIYVELENDDVAIDLLNEITEDDPTYLHSLLQLADLYQAQGLFEVAELKLLTAKQLDPNEKIIDLALGEFLFSIGEYKKAIVYYEKIIKETKTLAEVSIDYRLAEAYAAIGEYELALTYFDHINSDNPDTLFKHGVTAFQANDKKRAIHVWERVLDYDHNYHPVYYQLAIAYRDEGLVQKAYDTVKKGLSMDEFNKDLYYYAGVLAHQLDDDQESERLIREAIILDPDFKKAVLFLVELLKESDRHDQVIDLFNEIKKTGANDPLYEWELARAYNNSELYKDSLVHYKEAYNNLKEDSEFLLEYAYYLTEEGLINDAIPMFKAYLLIEPADVDTEQHLNRLLDTHKF